MTNQPIQIDPRFPMQVLVEVAYDGQDENGAPGPDVVEALAALESGLMARVGTRGQYAGRAAAGGLAQLQYYIEPDEALVDALSEAAQSWSHGGVDVRLA